MGFKSASLLSGGCVLMFGENEQSPENDLCTFNKKNAFVNWIVGFYKHVCLFSGECVDV